MGYLLKHPCFFSEGGAETVPAQYIADGRSAGGLRDAARMLDCHHAQYAKQLLTGWWDQSAGQDS